MKMRIIAVGKKKKEIGPTAAPTQGTSNLGVEFASMPTQTPPNAHYAYAHQTRYVTK